jgi:hypothetical protein
MMFIDFVHFVLNLLLAGFVLRFAQVKLSGTQLGDALAYLY